MESNRESILKKGYIKIFVLSILLLIAGILVMSYATILLTFAEPQTPGEYDALERWVLTFSTVRALCLQLGMLLFSLSLLMGALVDRTLSEGVRRGMVFTSGFGIVTMGIMMVSIIMIYLPY